MDLQYQWCKSEWSLIRIHKIDFNVNRITVQGTTLRVHG